MQEGEILDDYLVGLLPKGSRNVTFKDVKTGKIAKHLKEKQGKARQFLLAIASSWMLQIEICNSRCLSA